jgi:murein DD-endopeptidase MepM/ murein hydrolase activator NlpD
MQTKTLFHLMRATMTLRSPASYACLIFFFFVTVNGFGQVAQYPPLTWPVEKLVNFPEFPIGYVDHNDLDSMIQDYEGGMSALDGHRGTDIPAFNFREMDRGVKAFAAAPGVVTQVEYSRYDRNASIPGPDSGNFIIVRHFNGTEGSYNHFRENSIVVQVGDTLSRGDVIGLVGSSGNSLLPHLHLEIGEYDGVGDYTWRDPWNGPNQTLAGLWFEQPAYTGSLPFRVYDMGVYTNASAGGDAINMSLLKINDRPTQPIVFGANETTVAVWFNFSAQIGNSYTLEILRPDNSVYQSSTETAFSVYEGYNWHRWYWPVGGSITSSQYGTWTARVRLGSTATVLRQTQFQVDSTTVYPPRFYPLEGKSIRLSGSTQRDTLRVSSLGSGVTFSLINPPSEVSVMLQSDSIVVIGGTSTQATRSLYFQALATDTAGRMDTMWYHIVDMTKPIDAKAMSSFSYAMANGWNLISVPLIVDDYTKTTLYPTAISDAFAYQGSYVSQSTLANGKGYWLRFSSAQNVSQTGLVRTSQTIPVVTGWNLIGSLTNSIAVGTIVQNPSGIVQSSYFGFNGGYVAAATLDPGKGYWVKVSQNGTLTLDHSFVAKGSGLQIPDATLNRIVFMDAAGNQGALYYGKGGANPSLYEVPPIPPAGSFDVRFASGSFAEFESDTSRKVSVQLMVPVYPLTISWESHGSQSGTLLIDNEQLVLNGSSSVTLPSLTSEVSLILNAIHTVSKPTEYRLEQNYPNPFNPSTTIAFDVPEVSHVRLTVYDLLGREVALLVNEERDSGTYRTVFNASNLASGVYLYRLQTGTFSATRRLLLLR